MRNPFFVTICNDISILLFFLVRYNKGVNNIMTITRSTKQDQTLAPMYLAKKAAGMILKYGDSVGHYRKFDDCFEQGNGDKVAVKLLKLAANDYLLLKAIISVAPFGKGSQYSKPFEDLYNDPLTFIMAQRRELPAFCFDVYRSFFIVDNKIRFSFDEEKFKFLLKQSKV